MLEGLRWLLRHGNEDGSWSAKTCIDHCATTNEPCVRDGDAYCTNYDEGLTGLALLCFLGAGFSNESKQTISDKVANRGLKLCDKIKDGLMFLKDRQKDDGSFSQQRTFMYNEALAAMALVENYGLSQNRYWKGPAQKAIDFICRAQRPSPNGPGLWGWLYASRQEVEAKRMGTGDDPELDAQLYESDVSVTAWCIMALKSAQICGLEVPDENMAGALEFVKWCTDPRGSGLVGYISPDGAGIPVEGTGLETYKYHVGTMSSLGMLVRTFVAHDRDDPTLEQSAGVLLKDLPEVYKDKHNLDYYYWYYGSLALNQYDGPDAPRRSGKYWDKWEAAMERSLLELQDDHEGTCNQGAWLDPDRWTHYGGPIYNTAINVLTLEVYYRFENAFGARAREVARGAPAGPGAAPAAAPGRR